MKYIISISIVFFFWSMLCVNAQTNIIEKKDTVNLEAIRAVLNDIFKPVFGSPIDESIKNKANSGDPDALYQMGLYSMENRRILQVEAYQGEFDQEALEWFEKAASKGHKKAAFMSAIIHYGMFTSFHRSDRQWQKRQTISYLKQVGLEKDPELMLYMAMIYRFDQPADHTKALEWCNKAISMGLPKIYDRKEPYYAVNTSLGSAYYIKAMIYKYGDDNARMEDNHFSADPVKYFENLKISADLGYEDAIYEIGECYYLGRFVPKSLINADSYWEKLPKDSWRYRNAQQLKEKNNGSSNGQTGSSSYIIDSSHENEVRQLLQD